MNKFDHVDHDALKLAAPAPGTAEEEMPEQSDEDRSLDNLCESWSRWCMTRRFYAPPARLPSVLGQLSGRSQPPKAGSQDATISAELMAFHHAYLGQPDALDKMAFYAYYVARYRPIKLVADTLGISRSHFYRLIGDFRRRVHVAAKAIEADNMASRAELSHAPERNG